MSLSWLEPFLSFILWMASISSLFFIVSILFIPWVIIKIPYDYFYPETRQPVRTVSPYPKLNFLLTIVKNLVGGLFIIAGLAMLVLPGQGLLTILIGMTLTNFPGKYKLEQGLVRRKSILRAMNWIRSKAHRPPIWTPPEN